MAEKKNGPAPADAEVAERRRAGRGAEPRRGPRKGGPERSVAGAMRLLVVDDDRVDRMAVRRALVRTGIAPHVEEADAVLPAIDLLGSEHFDCVFLDYNLPDGDGLTFLRGLRSAGLSTPVVMLTGQQDESITAQLVEAGAADYVPKAELPPARLMASLRRALPDLS